MWMRILSASLIVLLSCSFGLAETKQKPARTGPRPTESGQAQPASQSDLGQKIQFQLNEANNTYNRSGGAQSPAKDRQAGLSDFKAETYKDQLDQEVQKHFDDNKLPGLVVLYARDGLLTYKKSLGFADVVGGVKMNEHKVGRLNSVSKWVAGIVCLKAVEQGQLDLMATAKSRIDDLPDHHTYKLRDLLACRSGVRHYGEATSPESPGGDWGDDDYATALEAAPMFWHDPLAGVVGQYHYSTHGYTILGAALEDALNKSSAQIIQGMLSTPHGLPTLKAEDLSDGNAARMKFYTKSGNSNVLVTPENSTWKVWGGGIESTPMDVLKLGILLGDGKIISKQSLKTMMTRLDPQDSYCLGCNQAVENGNQVMAKSGSFKGSNAYVWLVPDRRMVMVVMANRDGADVDGLGKKLRSILLSTEQAEGEKADLVVQDFERHGGIAYKDGKWEIPVRFQVYNQGKAGANIAFVNSVQIGSKDRWTSFMDALAPKYSKPANATIKISDPGKIMGGRTIELTAFADAPIAAADTSIPTYGRINESAENNNKAMIEVKLPGGLDLDLTGEKPDQPTVPSQPGAKKPQRVTTEQPASPTRVPGRIGKMKKSP